MIRCTGLLFVTTLNEMWPTRCPFTVLLIKWLWQQMNANDPFSYMTGPDVLQWLWTWHPKWTFGVQNAAKELQCYKILKCNGVWEFGAFSLIFYCDLFLNMALSIDHWSWWVVFMAFSQWQLHPTPGHFVLMFLPPLFRLHHTYGLLSVPYVKVPHHTGQDQFINQTSRSQVGGTN